MASFSDSTENQDGRLIIVANRLPVTVKRDDEGVYEFHPSSGGLVSGLAGVRRKNELLWYGWPGLEVPGEDKEHVKERCHLDHNCIPIFMSEDVSDRHYNGFSNSVLWPLFHYHPEGAIFDDLQWDGYYEANHTFAKALAPDLIDDDIVWVQDYHLMLLPEMLRNEIDKMDVKPKNVKIGFFLHTPFPSSELFRILPVREQILNGVLHCDLIGFHTPDYARHFLNSCARVLGSSTIPSGVHFRGRLVEVRECPIGIDPLKFAEGLQEPGVIARVQQLQKRFAGVKVIVGVDRLDYIKGVQQKLHALEVFLTDHPEWIGKVVLIQVAVPSRGEVEEYKNLRAVVNELVGRINGRFGTMEFTPIHFMHKSVNFQELIALYSVSDVCLVTSTRDGMNLVSYEYIACQQERHGVLILSEFAGAAQSLTGALVVNPWDTAEVADALHQAVAMTPQQRLENYERLARVVNTKTSENWGTTFVHDINKTAEQLPIFELCVRYTSSDSESDVPDNVVDAGIALEGPGDFAIGRMIEASDADTEEDSEKYEPDTRTLTPSSSN